ncbi:MAG: hypothetical protein NVSMB26_16660 [Beijerinckiaceae bacterium]
MREVDHVGGAEDQDEAERNKRIDGTDADAGKQQLQHEAHASVLAWANICRFARWNPTPALPSEGGDVPSSRDIGAPAFA